MSGSTTWSSGSGTWGVDGNWTGGAPTASTNATISGSASETITVSAGTTATANTLTLSDPAALVLDLGSLALTGLTLTAGTLEVGAGSLTITDTGADSNAGTITSDGTLVGTVSISGSSFTNTGLILNSADVETIAEGSFINAAGGTLTVGAIASIATTNGTATGKSGTTYTTTATATILSAGVETISGTTFTNAGVINAIGGSLAITETSFTNTGTITGGSATGTYVAQTGTVTSSPTLTVGTVTTSTGTMSITAGTFNNSGTFSDKAGTIAVASSFTNSGTFTDAGATVQVGTGSGGSFLNSNTITVSSGTFNVGGASFNNTSTGSITISGKKAVAQFSSPGFTNTGHIAVSNGLLTIGSGTSVTGSETTWSSAAGSIALSGGTIVLDGALTLANLSAVKNSGGTLEIGGTFNNTGATLTVGTGTTLGTISLGTYFNLNSFANYGGEITGGTIHNAGGGLVSNFGTLDNLTYQGTLTIGGSKQQGMIIQDGVTLTGLTGTGPGTVVMGTGTKTDGYNNYFGVYGSTTLTNLNITMGGAITGSLGVSATAYGFNFMYGGGYGPGHTPDTLTLSSSVTISEAVVASTKGTVVTQNQQFDSVSAGSRPGDTLINQGSIIAAQARGDFDIEGQVLINQGSIAVSNGGTLEINTGFQGPGYATYTATNTGTITSVNSYVELGGTLTAGFLQHLTATGGHTYLQQYAYAYNTNASFSIGSGATGVANQLVLGGTIIGGTIVDSGSGLVGDGGALDGVTYVGNLDPLLDTNVRYSYTLTDSIYLQDSNTFETAGGASPGTIVLNTGVSLYGGSSSDVNDLGNTTITNATINIGVAAGAAVTIGGTLTPISVAIGEGGLYSGTFTLGSGTVLNDIGVATIESSPGTITSIGTQTGATNTYTVVNPSNVFLNKGTINATIAGDKLNIVGNEFINAGTMNIGAGATVIDTASTFINSGTISDSGAITLSSLSGGGTLDVNGFATVTGALDPSQSIYFGPGASDLILGSAEGLTNAISSGASGGQIEFAGITINGVTSTLNSDGTDYTVGVTATNNVSGAAVAFSLTDVTIAAGQTPNFTFGTATDGNAFIDLPCYAEGTRLATPHGDVAVENLVEGDMVLTHNGSAKPVKWIGHRHVDCASDRNPAEYWPVRIARHAFGAGMPHSDLLLSPDHAVFVEGALIPVKHLVNRVTITQEPRAAITYWHVELDQHDVVLAEGLPCETYLDTGNRNSFANGAVVDLRPSFERPVDEVWASAWADKAVGPLVVDGPVLGLVRDRLADRAVALGLSLPATVDIAVASAGHMAITVPAGAIAIRLVSRSGRVRNDNRLLGAMLAGVAIDGAAVPMNDLRFGTGFHSVEIQGDRAMRWTDGTATLFLGNAAADRMLTIDVAAMVDASSRQQAA